MPISDNSISLIRSASISQIVGHYLTLKHNKTSCPFHEEKTASFTVSEAKEMFKCFGCGRSGDGIAFVMEIDKLNFLEAVEKIASITGIRLEFEEVQDREKYEKARAEKDILKDVLKLAVKLYAENLWNLPPSDPVSLYLESRNITREDIAEWRLGWGSTEWKYLTTPIISAGFFTPAEKLGLIKKSSSDETFFFDGYRSRITIPIKNHKGETIGLAGRWIETDPGDAKKEFAKYINPPENDIYSKSLILYGLPEAVKAITERDCVYLVEGYFDVISMQKNGDINTVGTCGTALTTQQILLLKRYTNRVIVLRDSDPPGIKAAKRDIPLLLKNGFKADVVLLPEKHDPDSFILSLTSEQRGKGIAELTSLQDGFFWLASDMIDRARNDEFRLGTIQDEILELLSKIPNGRIRANYFDSLIKQNKGWPRAELQKQLALLIDQQSEADAAPEDDAIFDRVPKWMSKDEIIKNGYCTVKNKEHTGYYTYGGQGQFRITNFIITPLFHVAAGKNSRHLIQIENAYKKAVIDVESAAMVAPDLMQKCVVVHGNFIIFGAKLQYLNIASSLLNNFPMCFEVGFLGWQEEGFFAFVDKIFVPGQGLKSLDEWGIIKHKEENYLIPPACSAYAQLQGHGNDEYENHRVLMYVESGINFTQWARMMSRVYLEKGPVAVAYAILTAFRDIIFSIDHNCPHLYAFGERTSGKSKWAESITSFFFKGRAAFNLNSGTDFAFFHYMQLFMNCPAHLNEFDEKVIKAEWFQSIKGVFDGEGRQRGIVGFKDRAEIMKVKSTLILTGQFLCTMDDNSVISRSIIEGFNERELSQGDRDAYDTLKNLEEQGLSNLLVELLKYRDEFRGRYKEVFNETLSRWRSKLSVDVSAFNTRIMQNWCHLSACYEVMSKYITLDETPSTFEAYCMQQAVSWSGFIRSSDSLSEFWNTFAFLVDQNIIVEGWDYKIKMEKDVKIRRSAKEEYIKEFETSTKVIYIRLPIVHKHYEQAYRQRTGKQGMSYENLLHYFSSRKYYLGPNKQSNFKRWVNKLDGVTRQNGQSYVLDGQYIKSLEHQKSSSTMFYFDQLNIDIERSEPGAVDDPAAHSGNGNGAANGAARNGIVSHETAQDLPF